MLPMPNPMDEAIGEEPDPYFVHPRSDFLDERTRVLKCGDTFAVFDRRGDALPFRTSSQGLFHKGTRFLSGLALRIGGERPLLLGSTVRHDNALLTVDLANPNIPKGDPITIRADTIHVFRTRFVCEASCYERIRLTNHGMKPLEIALSIDVAADFADIFEVRGATRPRRGRLLPPEASGSQIVLRYVGLDEVLRTTQIECVPTPSVCTPSTMSHRIELPPKGEAELHLSITCSIGASQIRASTYDCAFERVCERRLEARGQGCSVRTSNELFNNWIERSFADLAMMLTETAYGPYPYAGVPWFDAVFGRDGLITAREVLWLNPGVARGVLRCLAATQAQEVSAAEDAEPGKIIHEMREGEMAALGEVPFGRYYGSVDATPLFVSLAWDYFARTGDRETIEVLWPAIRLALLWMDGPGDPDQDGFIEYARHSRTGLVQQGWKDSHDAVFHEDGRLVEAPVALCEAQAYAYAARMAGSKIAGLLGDPALASLLSSQASALKARFADAFWCEDLGMYALALDGQKRPCRVRTSNAGQCLFTQIAAPEHAARIMGALMSDALFSGWGIRTLASTEVRYNPMSYHNGSIWPHDNALVALGMAQFGRRDLSVRVLDGLFHASWHMDMHRMPELFCGFPKRHGQGPTLYPVACAPQSWAAGSVFLLLEACLGLEVDGRSGQVQFRQPMMPTALDWIEIKNLVVGQASIDLLLRRTRSNVLVEVLEKRGDTTVTVTKSV